MTDAGVPFSILLRLDWHLCMANSKMLRKYAIRHAQDLR